MAGISEPVFGYGTGYSTFLIIRNIKSKTVKKWSEGAQSKEELTHKPARNSRG